MGARHDPALPRRGVVRLLVPSPDRRRVLARPNGLAGWTLPAIPVDLPLRDWTREAHERAEALLGAPVEPLERLGPDAWAITVSGRISAAGSTWIPLGDAARLGADEALVRRWSDAEQAAPQDDAPRG